MASSRVHSGVRRRCPPRRALSASTRPWRASRAVTAATAISSNSRAWAAEGVPNGLATPIHSSPKIPETTASSEVTISTPSSTMPLFRTRAPGPSGRPVSRTAVSSGERRSRRLPRWEKIHAVCRGGAQRHTATGAKNRAQRKLRISRAKVASSGARRRRRSREGAGLSSMTVPPSRCRSLGARWRFRPKPPHPREHRMSGNPLTARRRGFLKKL